MLTEEKIREHLERWHDFSVFGDGYWKETDKIPVAEFKRFAVRMLKTILEELPTFNHIYFCREHERLYLDNPEHSCGKCRGIAPQDFC